jgi:hypothetical protein
VQPPLTSGTKVNQAVVAFLDGRRLKGFVFNFSAMREVFRLFPSEKATHESGTDVLMRDLKAIFFVKDFSGDPGYKEPPELDATQRGRKIEITFADGEKLIGVTDAYNKQKLGFFVFPTDARSNNVRIFVINKNVIDAQMR